jgi:hypothetical protein
MSYFKVRMPSNSESQIPHGHSLTKAQERMEEDTLVLGQTLSVTFKLF